MSGQPSGDVDESAGEQIDVEHIGTIALLCRCEQIEQQRRQAGPVQHVGHQAVTWAVPTAAAAMRKNHDAGRVVGNGEMPRHRSVPGDQYLDFLVAQHRCALDVAG